MRRPRESILPVTEAGVSPATMSIRVISRVTGIAPHTLRMWERRYGFPKPMRGDGGGRLYLESDVTTLLLIRSALDAGYRPGEVVQKRAAELERLLQGTASKMPALGPLPTVDELLRDLASDDVSSLQKALKQAAALLGPKRFVAEVAHPASVKVGELWADGKLDVRHEHMFTECLSSQLHQLLSAAHDVVGGPCVLLATLPDEPHSLGLEMIAVVLTASGATPRLLGIETPPEQIVAAARAYRCDAVGIAVMPPADLRKVGAQIRWMLTELPRRVPIWAGGAGAWNLDVDADGLVIVRDWDDLDEAINSLPR